MAHRKVQILFDELDELLDRERAALLEGHIEKIAALLNAKENLMDKVNALDKAEVTALRKLQEKVTRNQLLLDGALQGIRRASMRLAAIRHIRRNLETYGEDGRKMIIEGDVARKIEKRA